MKLGLQIPSFTWPGGTPAIGPTLASIVRTADEAGFDSIWVMDHHFQIRGVGPAEEPMLEGMTALGFIAGHTSRARLGLMVGGVHYRNPALWVKATTTLDVLSGGRAWLGIGAAWNQEESEGLGFPFPPLGTRFEMLEETLQIATQMWTGDLGTQGSFDGRHFHAKRLMNSPQSISRPRVPIMIGGGGERKTLRLVAQYADATNVFGDAPRIAHKYRVLREHCEALGRPYDEIERSTLQSVRIGPGGSGAGGSGGGGSGGGDTAAAIVDRFGELADAGAQHVIFSIAGVSDVSKIELIGRDVIPQLRGV